MEKELKDKIETSYYNYKLIEKVAEQKYQQSLKDKEQLSLKTSLDVEGLKKFHQDKYVDLTLMVAEQQTVFYKLFVLIDLFKEFNYTSLSDEIVEFYNSNRIFSLKEAFVVKEDKLIEKEEGLLEKRRKAFLESDQFKNIMKGVKET